MIAYADFIEQFPAFSSLTEAQVNRALNLSSKLLDKSTWGDFYEEAVFLDSAHNLAIRIPAEQEGIAGSREAAAGQVNSVSAAGMSVSFSQMNIQAGNYTDEWYSKTSYGQEFLRLRSVVIPLGVML